MQGLRLENLSKSFGQTHALRNVSFQVQLGEVLVVLGPSGCGKSTLLAVIAGLETPDGGDVSRDGESILQLPPYQRSFGLMFQDFALFPHRDVYGNVAFGLQMAGLPRAEIDRRVEEVLELVGLPGFTHRDVNTLSGGEGQRVALARSLAPRPSLLMLDEPLGSLDRNLRDRLALDLRQILRNSQQTAIYVTHDQEEAFRIADRVVVMNAGKVQQIGAPQEIFRHPACEFVARFLGMNNLFRGEIQLGSGGYEVNTPLGAFPAEEGLPRHVTVLFRPDSISLGSQGPFQIQGLVKDVTFLGDICRVIIQVSGVSLALDFPSNSPIPKSGETVSLSFDPEQAVQLLQNQC
jgi:thiamine transport system ATP-binding protein